MNMFPKPQKCVFLNALFESVLEKVNIGCFEDERIIKMLKSLNEKLEFTLDKVELNLIYDKNIKKDGYKIIISTKQIDIFASSESGIYYSLQTLKQLLKEKIHCGEIEDYPLLEVRGVMLDISRSKVPSLKTLKQLVDLFSILRFNHLELYVEGFSFEYKSFKEVNQNGNYLPLADFKELERYCEESFIDLVPNQNGFGHMADWLSRDEFKHLAECPNGFYIWGADRPASTLDVTNEESVEFVKKLYDDMLPHFKSKYFNMCFDEPFELGHGKSAKLCEEIGEGMAFISFFNKLEKHVKTYHKKALLWGDVLIKHPDCIKYLPDDATFIDWGYHESYDFEGHAKMLEDKKVDYILAPGTITWSTLLGKDFDMQGTIKHACDSVKLHNGKGVIVTDWGDIGHLQYIGASLPGFIFTALNTWNEGDIEDVKDVLERYLNNRRLAEIIIELSKYSELEGPYRDYGTRVFSTIMWAEHASRYEEKEKFFLEKMKFNLIDESNINRLDEFFNKYIEELETFEQTLIVKEFINSLKLLKILNNINHLLDLKINHQLDIDFTFDIEQLITYSEVHKSLWCARNIHAGFEMSNQRILWLVQILTQITRKENI